MKRFIVQKAQGGGWRVTDTKTGHLHTAAMKDKVKCQLIADRMNDRVKGN